MKPKILAAGILAGYLGFVLVLTLVLFRQHHPPVNLIPFRSIVDDWQNGGRAFVVNFMGNLVVFMPFGLLLPSIRPRTFTLGVVLLACFLLSLAIETLQYLGASRVADVDDVLLNTLGGGLGYLVRFRRIASRSSDGLD